MHPVNLLCLSSFISSFVFQVVLINLKVSSYVLKDFLPLFSLLFSCGDSWLPSSLSVSRSLSCCVFLPSNQQLGLLSGGVAQKAGKDAKGGVVLYFLGWLGLDI